MSENKSTNQTANVETIANVETTVNEVNPLTAREVFEKIAELQGRLQDPSYSFVRLDESITAICDGENEDKASQVSEVCGVYQMRETTLLKMLDFYERMYSDLMVSTTKKAELIKSAFSEQIASIENSDLSENNKVAVYMSVNNKIAALIDKL